MSKITVKFEQNYYLNSGKYFSFISFDQFVNYFLPSDYKYELIHSESPDLVIYDISTRDNANKYKNSINLFISIENMNKWKWYNHPNIFGEYGDPYMDIYYYNHSQDLIKTSSYLSIPTLHAYINYYLSECDSISVNLKCFSDKKDILTINKSTHNSDIERYKDIISNNGYIFDNISIYNDKIQNKSCYHSKELLEVLNNYKFILCIENSYSIGYMTEKIFNCFFSNTIPVYLGNPDVCKYINPECFIDLRSENWLEKLNELNCNQEKYMNAINSSKIAKSYNNDNYKEILYNELREKLEIKRKNNLLYNQVKQEEIKEIKKIISFSLWGKEEFYNYGAYENAVIAKELFPDWICRFYYSNIDPDILYLLKNMNNVELICKDDDKYQDNLSNTLWRFYPAFYEKDIILIVRDTDSRLNMKEKIAIDNWLNSDKDFHILRDHPWHVTRILAGLWGVKNNLLLEESFQDTFNTFYKKNEKGVDQEFLMQIYDKIKEQSLIYDTYHLYKDEQVEKFQFTELYTSFVGAYCRNAPNTFAKLNKPNRLLNLPPSLQNVTEELCCRY